MRIFARFAICGVAWLTACTANEQQTASGARGDWPLPPDDTMLFAVYFAAGRWDLDERARATIREIVAAVRQRRHAERGLGVDGRYVLNVVGYSDTVGSEAASQRVSELRATTVACALLAAGLEEEITARGYGKANLAIPTPNNTPELRNRRVNPLPGTEPRAGSTPLDRLTCDAMRARGVLGRS
jgi:outer membrane protein OmpA-like peptidoglycan-associated protein